MLPLTYRDYVGQLRAVCLARRLPLDVIGMVASGDFRPDLPLYRVTLRRPLASQQPVAFVAGVHGDEQGGPLGVLQFLKERYPGGQGVACPLYPVANPFGYDEQTRRNAQNQDINRTFGVDDQPSQEARILMGDLAERKFSFLHTLHEDDSRDGAYVYYSDESRRWLAERLLEVAKGRRVPINSSSADCDGRVKFYGGLAPYNCPPYPVLKSRCPLEDRWLQQGVDHFCTESPGQCDLWTRAGLNAAWLEQTWRLL